MEVVNIGGATRYWFAQAFIEAAKKESDMVASVASAQSSTSVSVRMNAQYVHGEATPVFRMNNGSTPPMMVMAATGVSIQHRRRVID